MPKNSLFLVQLVLGFAVLPSALGAQALTSSIIEKMIADAAEKKQTEIVIPPGTYRLTPSNSKQFISIKNISGLKIVMRDVKIICTEVTRALSLEGLKDVEIEGLTIDYDPLPFTQGKVVQVNLEGDGSLDFKIDTGYPDPTGSSYKLPPDKVQLYDSKTRLLKKNVWDMFNRKISALGGGLIRVERLGSNKDEIKEGDLVVLTLAGKNQNSHTIRIEDSSRVVFRNVTIHTGPVFGVSENTCDGISYIGVKIALGPKPDGAVEPRLLTTTADGIHSTTARKGPLIENCLIECNGDDGIAIHGYMSPVFKVAGNTLWVGPRGGRDKLSFDPGETILFARLQTGESFGSAKIKKSDPVGDKNEILELEKIGPGLKLRDLKYFPDFIRIEIEELSFKNGFSSEAGDLICSASAMGNGYRVVQNVIRNNRARGINIKAGDGLVEGNNLEHIAMAGISFCPGTYFLEAYYAKNVVIKDNTIKQSGWTRSSPEMPGAGALSIAGQGSRPEYPPAGGHQNVQIIGNVFESCYGVNLLVASAENIQIKGNRFTGSHPEERSSGSKKGVDGKKLVWLDQVKQVALEGNVFGSIGPGGDAESPLGFTPSATGITGEKSGLTAK